ncbi:MAG: hypothetical protein DME30_09345 [Verrucomicrobia bacterium]|nr:MAG: hypothetical protein DME30_09345 [Verrucomicrobiota bacterium]
MNLGFFQIGTFFFNSSTIDLLASKAAARCCALTRRNSDASPAGTNPIRC